MYIPAHFTADAAAVRELLSANQAADLVTMTEHGLVATSLPFVYDPDAGPVSGAGLVPDGGPASDGGLTPGAGRAPAGGSASGVRSYGSLLGHLARNNGQWRDPVIGEALVIMRGPDGYVSPSWYASKAEHGRVVPTWNYITAHVYGRLVVHDDPAWVDGLVRRLTGQHEAGRAQPWSVDDAPAPFVAGQLRAIVGIELVISRVEAKFKLSQNRPAVDVEGVIDGLRAAGDAELADAMRRHAA